MNKGKLLKTILKPMLPKLEGFFNSQELEEGEISSSAMINIKGGKVDIRIVALGMREKENGEKELYISRVIDAMDGEDLV